jgi:outer membrane protein OmpA-like peptidoglycan-associated protein
MIISNKTNKSAFAVFALVLSSIVFTPAIAHAAPNGSCNTSEFSSGNGSSESPYLVSNATDFAEVADCGANGYTYSQTQDISLSGTWQNEIGFTGAYYGNGNAITGLYIDGANGAISSRGLFPSIYEAFLGGVNLTGTIVNAVGNTGLLAGLASHSSISGVTVYTDISLNASRFNNSYSIGGIVGGTSGNCDISGSFVMPIAEGDSVDGDGLVGGIAGDTGDTIVVNSGSYIDVKLLTDQAPEDSTWDAHAGGLVGYAILSGDPQYENYSISTNFALGNVICASATSNCGGLIGYTNQIVHDSYATGAVTGGSSVGGLVGRTSNEIYASYATGNVSGQMGIGGIVGYSGGYEADGMKITESYATGDVTASYGFAGGISGMTIPYLSTSIQVSKVFAAGDVTAPDSVGGLFGLVTLETASLAISNSYAVGNLSKNGFNGGGIIGEFRFLDETSLSVDHVYFGGHFLSEGFDGFAYLSSGTPVTQDLTTDLTEILWTKDSMNAKSTWLPASNALPTSLFKHYATFENWDLVDVWKLDLEANSEFLSLRGIGTSDDVQNANPSCQTITTKSITFKKNSAKLSASTRNKVIAAAEMIRTSFCSYFEISGYSSKADSKSKQKKLALDRAKVVRKAIVDYLTENDASLVITAKSKGTLKKGSASKNQKAVIKSIS